MIKKWPIIILSFVIVVCVIILAVRPSQPNETEVLQERCSQIELGMDYQQVLDILGAPKKKSVFTRDGIKEERWYYLDDPIASTPINCSFDPATQRVFQVLCGEASRKGFDDTHGQDRSRQIRLPVESC